MGPGPERRSAPRYALVADVEVTELSSNTTLNAKTSDVSVGGCFLYALCPFPKGAEVRVKISANNATFTAVGNVVFDLPNMGMGISYNRIAEDQLAILQEWILSLSPA
jgi:hypothetical protein